MQRDNPGVIAPPPLLFLGCLAAGLALEFLVMRVPTGVPELPRFAIGLLSFTCGVVLFVGALGRFRSAGTRVEPWQPTTALVTSGIYRITRNPIYVAMTLVYFAVAVVAGSLLALALLPVALALVRYGVIAREERYLEAKFGDAYKQYKATVRRWI